MQRSESIQNDQIIDSGVPEEFNQSPKTARGTTAQMFSGSTPIVVPNIAKKNIEFAALLFQMIQKADNHAELFAMLTKVALLQEPVHILDEDDEVDEHREQAGQAYLLLQNLSRQPEALEFNEIGRRAPKTRGYVDGCFDLTHAGHFNAMRQASLLTDHLVCGVNSDADIIKNKGPPVLNIEERMRVAKACKWVGECIKDTPYTPDEQLLDQIHCSYYLHGDDPCINAEGVNICEELNKVGKFRVFKRTAGISTTTITGRLMKLFENEEEKKKRTFEVPKQQFLQTSTRIAHFSNQREPKPTDTIVYMHGSMDMMHPGWIERIRIAKQQGDFLYVGVWDDDMTKYYRGQDYPIQTLQERILEVLACKYVDEVVIGSPYILTLDLIKTLNIHKVIGFVTQEDKPLPEHKQTDQYLVAKNLKIYQEISRSEDDLTLEMIAQRIFNQRKDFMKKIAKKSQSEDKYYENKQFVSETNSYKK